MKRIIALIMVLTAVFLCTSCGAGKEEKEKYKVGTVVAIETDAVLKKVRRAERKRGISRLYGHVL